MPDDTQMTITERRTYLGRMHERYRRADRLGRGQLLGEMETVTGMHRKRLLRLRHAPTLRRQPRTQPRAKTDGAQVDAAMRVIWERLDDICAERRTPALVLTAQQLVTHGELVVTDAVLAQLHHISVASVQRRLTRFPQDTPRLPRRGPDQAKRVARGIPVRTIAWNEARPGPFEVDLVHHGGAEPGGDYVHPLQMIDLATGWSERVAVLGRSQWAMEGGFRRMLARRPFPVRELHSDHGSAFLNNHLVRFWGPAITGLPLSRSGPYQKNDQRFVEQKNATLVRADLGQVRLDTAGQTDGLNALDDQRWVSDNLFQPVMRLREKVRIDQQVIRRWDTAQTPLARRLATEVGTLESRQRLQQLQRDQNPRALRQAIYRDLAR